MRQLRLFWYDPDGWLVTDEVPTIRLDSSFHSLYDYFYFDTAIDWQPGNYSLCAHAERRTLCRR